MLFAPPPLLPPYLTDCAPNEVVICPSRTPPPAPSVTLTRRPLEREPSPYWLELRAIGLGTNSVADHWLMRTDDSEMQPRDVLIINDGFKRPLGGPTTTRVVDTRSCPGLRDAVADMRALTASPPLEEPTVKANEQPYYVLDAEGPNGQAVVRRGSSASSLERWMVRTRERTRTCPTSPA